MITKFLKLIYYLFLFNFVNVQRISAISSCAYPPCRFTINRQAEDLTPITVDDHSTHLINWQWDVRGGRWNVTYKYYYDGGLYEGSAVFINCSAYMHNKEQAFVSWGNAKDWDSNAVTVYANAWNITYNGDIFGFVPSGNGRYIFRIYTKNKRHNPFADGDIIVAPDMCSLASSDLRQLQKWWALRKNQRNCPEVLIKYSWNGKNGKWRIVYKWDEEKDITTSDVFYKFNNNGKEFRLIHWELDDLRKSVSYVTNPVRIYDENSWIFTLSNTESWGFQPNGIDNKWIFRYFSRNLVFYPFQNTAGRVALS